MEYDLRYIITPKKKSQIADKEYIQVFSNGKGFVPGLSIVDLIFTMGPEAYYYLKAKS